MPEKEVCPVEQAKAEARTEAPVDIPSEQSPEAHFLTRVQVSVSDFVQGLKRQREAYDKGLVFNVAAPFVSRVSTQALIYAERAISDAGMEMSVDGRVPAAAS